MVSMADLETAGKRQELHILIDHLRAAELDSVREYLRARLEPAEFVKLTAPVDSEPMSKHERAAWEADRLREERGEPTLTADELLQELGLTSADIS